MKHFLAQTELEHELQSVDFVLATQFQLAKDFGMSGIDFDPNFVQEPLNYEALREIVEDRVSLIMQSGERQLLQLLYQIDVPQQDFLALTTEADFLPRLGNLIIRREAYKVFLRRKF